MKHRVTPAEIRIAIEHKGKVYQGSYFVDRDTITVSYGIRQVVMQLGNATAPTLARVILRKIVSGEPTAF